MAAPHDQDGIAPPSNDAYTGMLTLSLLALVGACALLYLDYSQYGDRKPDPLKQLPPDQKFAQQNPIKAKVQNKEFHLSLASIELFQGGNAKEVTVKNGKATAADFDPMDANMSAEILDTKIKISAGAEAKDQVYTLTITSDMEKKATLKVTVNKAKE